MSEVGGYELHLYCDVPDCRRLEWYRHDDLLGPRKFPDVYTGVARRHAVRAARRDGWKRLNRPGPTYGDLGPGDVRWRCPDCVTERKGLAQRRKRDHEPRGAGGGACVWRKDPEPLCCLR